MSTPQLTPSEIRFPNDAAPPEGFCDSPRSLTHELWRLNAQVAALCDAIARLCELQREVAKKLDEALNKPIAKEVA